MNIARASQSGGATLHCANPGDLAATNFLLETTQIIAPELCNERHEIAPNGVCVANQMSQKLLNTL